MDYREEEEMITCPYDESHVLKPFRIQGHLIKCRKNHPNVQLSSCMYNASHLLKASEMAKHLEICPNKRLLEESRYHGQPVSVPYVPKPKASHYDDTFEGFDEECNTDFSSVKTNKYSNPRGTFNANKNAQKFDDQVKLLEEYDKVMERDHEHGKPQQAIKPPSEDKELHRKMASLSVSKVEPAVEEQSACSVVNYDNFGFTHGAFSNSSSAKTFVIGRGRATRRYEGKKQNRSDISYLVPDISDLSDDEIPARPAVGKHADILYSDQELSVFEKPARGSSSVEEEPEDNLFLRSMKGQAEKTASSSGEANVTKAGSEASRAANLMIMGRGRGFMPKPSKNTQVGRGFGRGRGFQ